MNTVNITALSGCRPQQTTTARGASATVCRPLLLQVCHAASDEVLVTGGYDTAVKVWDCRSWNQEPIQTMRHCKVRS